LSKPTYALQRAKPLNTGGGGYPTREGGSGQCTQSSTTGKFLFNPLSSSQEGRSDETGNQPQEVEQMDGAPTLQDGGYGDPQRVVESEQLDGEGESQRCILHSPKSSTPPSLPGGPSSLPVYLPTLWPVLCTMGIYQSDEANHNLSLKYGGLHGCLYR